MSKKTLTHTEMFGKYTIAARSDEYGRMVDAAQVAHADAFCLAVVPHVGGIPFGPSLPATSVCTLCENFVSVHVGNRPNESGDRVADFLVAYNGENAFLLSVRDQWNRRGEISPAQRAAVTKFLPKEDSSSDHAESLDKVEPKVDTVSMNTTPTADPVIDFLTNYNGSSSFLLSVKDQYARKGSLSPAQYAAVAKNVPAAKPVGETKPVAEVPSWVSTRLPDARYCVASRTTGKLAFFKIDTVTEDGNWKGWTFVKQIIGGHDDERVLSIAPNGKLRGAGWVNAMLDDIAADPEAAKILFAARLERCWHCGRVLTDVDTALKNGGLGPVCVNKY
jgi:hypothetical protein